MKSLVVFYSLDGNTKLIADLIAEESDVEILQLKPKKEIPKSGFKKFFWGGKSIVFKEKPILQNEMPDIKKYDIVFIGTPIWSGSYAPPVYTFISECPMINKKLAFFACHSGGGAEKCFDKLRKDFHNNTLIGSISFDNPIKMDRDNIKYQVSEWLNNILKY